MPENEENKRIMNIEVPNRIVSKKSWCKDRTKDKLVFQTPEYPEGISKCKSFYLRFRIRINGDESEQTKQTKD